MSMAEHNVEDRKLKASPKGLLIETVAQFTDGVAFGITALTNGGILLFTISLVTTVKGGVEIVVLFPSGGGCIIIAGVVSFHANIYFLTRIRDETSPDAQRAAMAKIFKNFNATLWTNMTLMVVMAVLVPVMAKVEACDGHHILYVVPAFFFCFQLPVLCATSMLHAKERRKAEADPDNTTLKLFRDAKDKVLTEYENAFGFMCAFSFEDAFSKTLKCTFDTDMLVSTVVMTIIFVSGATAVLGFCLGWVLRKNGLKSSEGIGPQFVTMGVSMTTIFLVLLGGRGLHMIFCSKFNKVEGRVPCVDLDEGELLFIALVINGICFGIMQASGIVLKNLSKGVALGNKALGQMLLQMRGTIVKGCCCMSAFSWAWFFFEVFLTRGVPRLTIALIGATFIITGALFMVLAGHILQLQLTIVRKATLGMVKLDNPLTKIDDAK